MGSGVIPVVIGNASLYNVDCRDLLASLPDNSMDSIVTPPQGKVLDLFMGSGSTGKAAAIDGFTYYGVEKDTEHNYFDISKARIAHAACEPIPDLEPDVEAVGQQGLFA